MQIEEKDSKVKKGWSKARKEHHPSPNDELSDKARRKKQQKIY